MLLGDVAEVAVQGLECLSLFALPSLDRCCVWTGGLQLEDAVSSDSTLDSDAETLDVIVSGYVLHHVPFNETNDSVNLGKV